MKRNARIIQISGFRGILLLGFVACCLVAGFGVFPSIVAMHSWNWIAQHLEFIPMIGFWQGVLLWAGIAIVVYLANEREKFLFSVTPKRKLSEDEVKRLLMRIKAQRTQALDTIMTKYDSNKTNPYKQNSDNVENIGCTSSVHQTTNDDSINKKEG